MNENLVIAPPLFWDRLVENMLIEVFVPEADQLSHGDALAIALDRDEQAAKALQNDFSN